METSRQITSLFRKYFDFESQLGAEIPHTVTNNFHEVINEQRKERHAIVKEDETPINEEIDPISGFESPK